jgi:hypothetical protein
MGDRPAYLRDVPIAVGSLLYADSQHQLFGTGLVSDERQPFSRLFGEAQRDQCASGFLDMLQCGGPQALHPVANEQQRLSPLDSLLCRSQTKIYAQSGLGRYGETP